MADERGTGTFKLATNRQQELILQEELKDVAKKSIGEIAANKETRRNAPLNDSQKNTIKLAPEFAPSKVREKRKTQPVFHDDLTSKQAKVTAEQKAKPPLPSYNPLDREHSIVKLSDVPTKKLPFSKENAITTEDSFKPPFWIQSYMKKPKISSVGIVPARDTEEVDGVAILMEGKQAVPRDDPVLGPVQRANTVQGMDILEIDMEMDRLSYTPVPERETKPAILGATGSTRPITFTQRPAPPSKPRTQLRRVKTARSDYTSSDIPVTNDPSKYDEELGDLDPRRIRSRTGDDVKSRTSSAHTVKSTKDLLDEARKIASPGKKIKPKHSEDRAKTKKPPKRDYLKPTQSMGEDPAVSRSKSIKSVKSGSSDTKMKGKSDDSQSTERSVEQIITSLKDMSKSGNESSETEADRKIQEIMKRVMSRTKDVLGEDEPGETEEDTTEPTEDAEDEPPPVEQGSSGSGSKSAKSVTLSRSSKSVRSRSSLKSDYLADNEFESSFTDEPITEKDTEESEATGLSQDPKKDPSTTVLDTTTTSSEQLPTSDQPSVESERMREALEKLAEVTAPPVPENTMVEEPVTQTDLKIDLEEDEAEEDGDEVPDLEKAWQDLNLPQSVRHEDIINVKAKPSQLHKKQPPPANLKQEGRGASFLTSWGTKDDEEPQIEEPVKDEKRVPPPKKEWKSVHHFCTSTEAVQLPDHYRGVWRRYHVPSRFDYLPPGRPVTTKADENKENTPSRHTSSLKDAPETPSMEKERREREHSAAAKRILLEANKIGATDDNLETWEKRAQEVFDQPEFQLGGGKMPLKADDSFLYWTPAPPKWDIPSSTIKQKLFPEYHGAALTTEEETFTTSKQEIPEDEEDAERAESEDTEERAMKERILTRNYGSHQDLSNLEKARIAYTEAARDVPPALSETESQITITTPTSKSYSRTDSRAKVRLDTNRTDKQETGTLNESISERSVTCPPGVMSFTELKAKMAQAAEPEEDKPETSRSTIFPVLPPIKRPSSAPGTLDEDDEFLMIYQDFNSAMDEISKQKKQLKDIKSGKLLPPSQRIEVEEAEEEHEEDYDEEEVYHDPMDDEMPESKPRSHFFTSQQSMEPTPAELALQAGRAYVILPQKSKNKKKKKGKVDMSRIEDIERFLDKKPNKLERCTSMRKMKRVVELELRVPPRIRYHRRSLPNILDYNTFKFMNRIRGPVEVEREQVRNIWEKWFDETFPPTPAESEWEDSEEEKEQEEEKKEEKPVKRKPSQASTVYDEPNIEVYPVIDDVEDEDNVELLQDEVVKLTEKIENSQRPNAFDYCRRGAILRKLGKIGQAHEDLNMAISMEPQMLNAYWHRHLILILRNKKRLALEDLNQILKINKTHSAAYRSRAALFKEQGDITMAIVNYTQAIKFNPNDFEAYYQRAEMYEKRGEMLLALEDFSMVTKINPSKTSALKKHGLHYFNNKQWSSAITDFTELLKVEPGNAEVRTIRGRAYSQLKQWDNALEDLSAAIHLDPNNAKAFYYRGCLLRKLHPKKALQDFSASLMIDDSEDNMLSYLHRAILYYDIGKHDDSIPDFEAVLKLDSQCACAHVSLGLIFMNKMENHHRETISMSMAHWIYTQAIKKFTAAIKADPTYVKAYICRAEAYSRIHEIGNALLDITRAIHLRPDVHHYYMYRGQLVLKMGNLSLAAYCVKHAASLQEGLGQSPTQQAIVQSFLKNYDKAIEALLTATRTKPVAPLFMLLGKTQMKAQLWKDAVDSFQRALDLVQKELEDEIPFMGRKPWQDKLTWPLEAAEMYYLMGMCYMEVRDYSNAHEAFNNAIKVNAKYPEAYYQRGLSRMRLKQSKGIQDFNRALALKPDLFQAFLSRAAYYGLRGQYTKAILNCNEAIKLQPRSVRSYLYRGALKYHIKAYTLAIRDLTTAISIDSCCQLAYFNRAVCYQDSGNWQKALQDYGIVLLLGDLLSLKVLNNRGLLYYDKGDYKNALHDFMMAADVFPLDKKIHHTLGLCYHKLGKLQEAVKSFTRALELDKYFLDALICRGNVFMDFGHEIGHRYARFDYERALHYDPLCLPARVNLAYTLQVAGKFQQAWHQFTAAITIDAAYRPALEGRAIINLQMSDTFAAYQDINTSVKVKPTAELLTNRGVIHQFMNDRVNAMRDYQKAIQYDNTYALAYFNAANIYFHTRQFKQALDYYNTAITYNTKDESAFLNRAITKVLLKDSKGALTDFGKAIKLSPYSAHMYFNRGNLYASMTNYDSAEKDYTQSLDLQPDDPLVHKRRAEVRGKLGKKQDAIADYKRAVDIQSRRY